jgi:type IX secretion system PorP/SprF family membrane protein
MKYTFVRCLSKKIKVISLFTNLNYLIFKSLKFQIWHLTSFISIFIFFSNTTIHAQQAAQYSLYSFQKYQFNPAYAGLDGSVSGVAGFRKQWSGLEGSPTNQVLHVHAPVYYLHGGVGMSVEHESLGAEDNLAAKISYAYHISLGEASIVSLSVGGGMVQRTLDGTKLRTPDGRYESGNIRHNDLLLLETAMTAAAPTVTTGAYFHSDNLEVGIAADNIWAGQVKLNSGLSITPRRNYYFNAQYNLEVSDHLAVQPSIFVKSDAVQTQTEASLLFRYNENIFAGASYRGYNKVTQDAVIIIAGLKVSPNTMLAYAYDVTLSPLQNVSTGSHELLLSYNLNKIIGKGIPPKIIYNPRFL